MGAYLSTPVTEKESCDSASETLRYGASSMQGWRVSQEDSHNCCPDFDPETGTALFAVYDGHGGAEVAQYTSMHLPEFIKQLPAYTENRLAEALEKAFLGFDNLLTKEEVIKELREIAGVNIDEDEKEKGEGSDNEAEALYEEATMPLEKLLERYGGPGMKKNLADLRKKHNILSPLIRKKADGDEKEGDETSELETADVKVKLDEQLMNGHGDDSNSEAAEEKIDIRNANATNSNSIKEALTKGKACNEQNLNSTDVTTDGNDPVSSTTKTIGHVNTTAPVSKDSGVESEVSSSDVGSTDLGETDKSENACSTNSAEPTGVVASTSEKTEESSSSVECSNSIGSSNSEVSSTAVGSSTTAVESSAKEGDSSMKEEPSSNAVGSSTSSVGPSHAGSSSEAGGSSACTGSSGKTEGGEPEAGSSTGRTRKTRKNVIPEEGEDESSFDEDEEDDEDADVDEEDWGSGSSSEDEDEEEEDGDDAEHGSDEDEEDEQMEVMCGGEEPGADSGCTAVVALLRGCELYVANAGDSRCVLSREGKAVDMSVDHKPEDELERKRIVKAGGRVTFDGRVNGGLNLSRAIGDHCYKKNSKLSDEEQMITALPDIRCMTLDEKDQFMVLACDGIWNVMTSQDVVNFVAAGLASGTKELSKICEQLFDYCIAPDTTGDGTGCDNMTCVIVTFEKLGQCVVGTAKRRSSTEADSTDATDPKKLKAEQD